jgi:glutathionylspermidine synthase
MKRHRLTPRPGWEEKVEALGLAWHTQGEQHYWDESVAYEFTADEVDRLEETAEELHHMYWEAADTVVRHGWWARCGIREEDVPVVRASWERRDVSLYGRFDVIMDSTGQPKLLEYNADTPTSLLESAVVQWHWLQELRPASDQFNSIHERLIEAWKTCGEARVHFSAVRDHLEDETTVTYLMDTAHQAGLQTSLLTLDRIGWDAVAQAFTDEAEEDIKLLCKLYPWEWMLRDPFAACLPESRTRFVEPTWKLLLSNKGMLPVLWELFPGHPALLPAAREADAIGPAHVRKPIFSREGANITIVEPHAEVRGIDGGYGAEGFVYQAIASSLPHDGMWPVLGLWMVDGKPAGMGIREDASRITGNLSRFVPHWFDGAS